jgi:hypothetical protein
VPPKQPIRSANRTSKCVSPRPVSRREQDQPKQNRESASGVEDSLTKVPSKIDALAPDQLVALHAFFTLLSQWDESLKGEIEHE